MEEFLAAVPARAACLLAGTLMMRLIRAFLAMPSPAIGPAPHPAGPVQGRHEAAAPGPADRAGAGAYGDDG